MLKFKLNTFLVREMLPENQVKEGTNNTQFLATFPKTKKKLTNPPPNTPTYSKLVE